MHQGARCRNVGSRSELQARQMAPAMVAGFTVSELNPQGWLRGTLTIETIFVEFQQVWDGARMKWIWVAAARHFSPM